MRFTIILFIFLLFSINGYSQKNKQYNISKKVNDTHKINALPEVHISGSILKSVKIAKNGLDEMNLPQSMQVINNIQIQQQQVNSITDILKNVPGMYIMGTTGGYQEEIASRGYNISSTNTFKNGIRFFNGMKIELSGIEKIEILKGNTAIDYGNVTPGGLLNIITKKPNFQHGKFLQISYASFENIKPQFDFWGTLHKKIAYRINGSYQQGNSFRNYVHSNTYYFNPSLLFNLNKKSSLLLEGDYTKYNTVPDFGAGIINYQIVKVPINRFTGVSWGKYNASQSFISAKYNYIINKKWNLNALIGYRFYNTALFSNTRPNSAAGIIDNNGNWKRSVQKSTIIDNYNIKQIDANTDFNIGYLHNKVLIGADFEQFTTQTTNYINFANYDTINIFNDYIATNEPSIPNLNKNTLTTNDVNRWGIYVQDLISYKKYIKFFIGARINYINSITNVYSYLTSTMVKTEKKDVPFTPKLGIIFQPNKYQTIFTTFSNSFTINTGIDFKGNALNISTIEQYELGIKNHLLKNKLQINATIYLINNDNLAQTSLLNGNTNTNIKELAGAIRNTGLELELIYKPIKKINCLLGYSFNESKYTASNIYIVGSPILYTPKHTANSSIMYDFKQGKFNKASIGLIGQYIGERYGGRSTRLTIVNDSYKPIKLNDYFVLDLVANYTYKNASLRGKIANILNQFSYNVHDDNSLNPITPINFSIQLEVKL